MTILSTTLTRPAGRTLAKLIIKQKEHDQIDGILSRAGLHNMLLSLLNEEEVDEPVCTYNCGAVVYVYRYDLSLPYTLFASHGGLGSCVRETVYVPVKLDFKMEDEKSLSLPCFGVGAHRWLGDRAWNKDGSRISPPGFTTTIDSLKTDQLVYGTLAVGLRVIRDRYNLALPLRLRADGSESEQNKFTSVVFAVHQGGPTWGHIDPPPGAEETNQQCTWGKGGGGEINPPEHPDQPPYASPRDGKEEKDYCTQEVISVSP